MTNNVCYNINYANIGIYVQNFTQCLKDTQPKILNPEDTF